MNRTQVYDKLLETLRNEKQKAIESGKIQENKTSKQSERPMVNYTVVESDFEEDRAAVVAKLFTFIPATFDKDGDIASKTALFFFKENHRSGEIEVKFFDCSQCDEENLLHLTHLATRQAFGVAKKAYKDSLEERKILEEELSL